jgi:hypothetical protein
MLPIVPHEFVGGINCCGCLIVVEHGDQAELRCNECDALVATVPAVDVEATLLKMAMQEGVCSETCTHCGAINVFPGFSMMLAFICRECDETVTVSGPVQ